MQLEQDLTHQLLELWQLMSQDSPTLPPRFLPHRLKSKLVGLPLLQAEVRVSRVTSSTGTPVLEA